MLLCFYICTGQAFLKQLLTKTLFLCLTQESKYSKSKFACYLLVFNVSICQMMLITYYTHVYTCMYTDPVHVQYLLFSCIKSCFCFSNNPILHWANSACFQERIEHVPVWNAYFVIFQFYKLTEKPTVSTDIFESLTNQEWHDLVSEHFHGPSSDKDSAFF